MDDDDFKEEMAKLRKFRNETEWLPLLVIAIFWGGLWWNGIKPEPQINALLGAVAVVGYLVFREVRAMHATILHSQILAARGKHIRL
ncbi:hypothetical protein [Tabrizicola sp.]|uniref:hypothetical protein n=1 Tax=Tabrizicola sp. TaxID=2005166 RepID=UPI001A50BE30|nr:hypothetical protein [Tabrizicola sp.]MBL9075747.1 hypothetical protein [Tabrizicola sp.]